MITYFFTFWLLYHLLSWTGLSTIVLGITAWVLYRQTTATLKSAEATEKSATYLEHQIKPITWFIIRSAKTRVQRGYSKEGEINKYDSELIVINGSNFPILFHFKISWEKDGKKLPTNDGYWIGNPLHIYPKRMSYPPSLINLDAAVKELGIDENSKGEVSATIEYRFSARHSPDKKFDGLPETWRFDLAKELWVGPNGIEDNNIFLEKESPIQKIKA